MAIKLGYYTWDIYYTNISYDIDTKYNSSILLLLVFQITHTNDLFVNI